MADLITIREVANRMEVSYHVARNRLKRNKEAEQFKKKLGHTVVYDAKVLEVLKECNR